MLYLPQNIQHNGTICMGTCFLQVSNGGGSIIECITCAGIYELKCSQILWYEWRYWRNYARPTMTSQNGISHDNNIPANSFILELSFTFLYYNILDKQYINSVRTYNISNSGLWIMTNNCMWIWHATKWCVVWMLDMWRIKIDGKYSNCGLCLYKCSKQLKSIETQQLSTILWCYCVQLVLFVLECICLTGINSFDARCNL